MKYFELSCTLKLMMMMRLQLPFHQRPAERNQLMGSWTQKKNRKISLKLWKITCNLKFEIWKIESTFRWRYNFFFLQKFKSIFFFQEKKKDENSKKVPLTLPPATCCCCCCFCRYPRYRRRWAPPSDFLLRESFLFTCK